MLSVWALLGALTAFGKITVKPVNVSADPGVAVQNAVVYVAAIYPSTVTAFTNGFLDPALTQVNLALGLDDESNGSRSTMMVFDVSSDVPPTPGLGQQLGLVIEAQGTTATAVPLAAAGFADAYPNTTSALPSCNGGGAACYSQSTTHTSYFFAIPFTAGRVMRVGFYPKDVCVVGTANNVNGCNGAVVSPTYPITMNLKFSVRVTTATSHAVAGGEDASEAIAVIFEKDPPSGCQVVDIDKLYTPADGAIYFYPDKVSAAIGSGAPSHSVFFVANKSPTVANISPGGTARSNNAIVATPAITSTGVAIGGFENAAAAAYTSPSYEYAVSVRDAAGLMPTWIQTCTAAEVPVCGGCVTSNDITTRDIRGFLEGRNCFISSTAYGIDSRWTEAFRKFRGDVLLKTRLGRWLTRQYYAWSPAGAAWLEGHDWARVSVAVALFPLALLVWIWVHVGTLGMLTLAVLGGMGWRLRRYYSRS